MLHRSFNMKHLVNATIVVLTILGSTAAKAADTSRVYLTVPVSAVYPGEDDVKVTVHLDNSAWIGGLQFTIADRPDYLQYVGCAAAGRAADAGFSVSCEESDTSITAILFDAGGDSIPAGNGALFGITYKVDSLALPGNVALNLSDIVLSDPSSNPLPVIGESAQINIVQRQNFILTIGNGSGGRGTVGNGVPIYFSSSAPVTGIEFTLCDFPDRLSFGGARLAGRAVDSAFDLFFSEDSSNDSLHIILMSLSGDTLPTDTGVVLLLDAGVDPWAVRYETIALDICGEVHISDADGLPVVGTVESFSGTFEIVNAAPVAGSPVLPYEGEELNLGDLSNIEVFFQWEEAYDIDGDMILNTVEFSLDEGFDSVYARVAAGSSDTVFTFLPEAVIPDLNTNHTVYWRVRAVDVPPEGERGTGFSSVTYFELYHFTGVSDEAGALYEFRLWDNLPNPFNPYTEITFSLPEAVDADLTIFDIRGRMVRKLAQGSMRAGTHTVKWDGRDGRGRTVGSGVYFYRLKAGERIEVKKMTLLR